MIINRSNTFLSITTLVATGSISALALIVFDIQATNHKTSELLNTMERISEEEAIIQSARFARSNAAEDIKAFEGLIFKGDKLVPFIEGLEEAGRGLSLETKILSVSKIEDRKAPIPYTIRIIMEVGGSWSGTFSFLRAIENIPNRIVVDDVQTVKDGNGWRTKITFLIYAFE